MSIQHHKGNITPYMFHFACGLFMFAIGSPLNSFGNEEVAEAIQTPTLQRALVVPEIALFFDFDSARGAATPALIAIRTNNAIANKYYPFGGLRPIHSLSWPFRWSLVDSVLFCSQSLTGLPPWPAAPGLFRFPLGALLDGPDDGRWPIEDDKIPVSFRDASKEKSLNLDYGCIAPVRDAIHGLHGTWKEGTNLNGDAAKAVYFDVRAINENTVELFMTADGELYKWLYDGRNWKNLKHYDLRVEGEFLVFDEGRSLVFQRDGKWATMRNIDEATPVVRDLADRVEDEPLILVEDRVSRTNHFIDRDRLLDQDGREISRLQRGLARDRIREAIETVITRRRP